MQERSSASLEETLQELLVGLPALPLPGEYPSAAIICAPEWVLERLSEETGHEVELSHGFLSVTTDVVSVTAMSSLEQTDEFGYVAAVDIIGGRCVEMTACHSDVPPDRWWALTLALGHGLGLEAAVAVETLSAD